MIGKNKKGAEHDLFIMVFELFMVAFIGLAIFNFVKDAATQTVFEKNYLSKDISSLINTLYSSPGEIEYAYNENTKPFILDFRQSQLEIYKKEEKSSPHIFYPFAEDKGIKFNHVVLDNSGEYSAILFYKSANSLDVRKNEK